MSKSAALAIGWFTLIGSAIGFFSLFSGIAAPGLLDPESALALFLCVAYFCFGIWSGSEAIERRPSWISQVLFFWLIQIPTISIGQFAFSVSTGIGAWVAIVVQRAGVALRVKTYIGSQIHLFFSQSEPDLVVGINLFACFVSAWLLLLRIRQPAQTTTLQDNA